MASPCGSARAFWNNYEVRRSCTICAASAHHFTGNDAPHRRCRSGRQGCLFSAVRVSGFAGQAVFSRRNMQVVADGDFTDTFCCLRGNELPIDLCKGPPLSRVHCNPFCHKTRPHPFTVFCESGMRSKFLT